jgi:hypothetical protein
MADGVTVKISNRAAFELRRDPAVIKELERRGKHIANEANKALAENSIGSRVRNRRMSKVGYKMSSFQGRKVRQGRWFVQVYTSSNHAKYSEAKHNNLIRVLNATQRPTPAATSLEDYTP